jgi:hypothetical protein
MGAAKATSRAVDAVLKSMRMFSPKGERKENRNAPELFSLSRSTRRGFGTAMLTALMFSLGRKPPRSSVSPKPVALCSLPNRVGASAHDESASPIDVTRDSFPVWQTKLQSTQASLPRSPVPAPCAFGSRFC